MDALLIEVHRAIAGVKEIEPAYEAARRRVHTRVLQLRQSIGDNQDLQRQTIAYLYWFENYVTLDAISEAFNIKLDHIKDIAYKEYPDIRCAQCGYPLINPSNKRPVRSLLCKSCLIINRTSVNSQELETRLVKAGRAKTTRIEKAKQLEDEQGRRKRKEKISGEAKEARIQELRAMPYAEYLQSREWNIKRHFAYKRAGNSCQLCNAKNTVLNVHHRTYERLGCEKYSDLIVLCQPCHQVFHQNGKLVKQK